MQNTLALHGRLAACFFLMGAVGCTEGNDGGSSSESGAPTAAGATFAVMEDGVLSGRLEALDPDGDELRLTIVAAPRSGELALEGDRFTYRPAANFHGEDELSFAASDGAHTSATARVTFRVLPVDDAPQLGANVFTGPSGFRITGQVAAIDPDGDTLTYAMPSPISGVLIEFDTSTGRFVFEPSPSLAGAELVPVAVVANGQMALGEVTFQLDAVSFDGSWSASDVHVDGQRCANFTLPLQSHPLGSVTVLEHEVRCEDGEATTYEPLHLPLDGDSPSSLHASQYLPIGPGAFVHLAITIDPIPAKPNTYRYVETFSGAFDQVTTATLTKA